MTHALNRPLPLPAKSRRAVAMIRVSKERDGMTSPDVQRHAIQQHADANNIHIIDWVEGIDESGSDRKSAWWPRLDQSIARIEAGECDTILVWRFSRVGRQRLRWAIALDKVDTLGGMIISVLEPIESSTASGRFARGMLGEMNAYQAELIGEQWKETHDRRRRAGLPHGGQQRFGYQRVEGRFVPDPTTGPILAEMYRRALRGDGSGRISRWLNESGVRTTQDRPWINSNIYQLLDTGFGAGLIIHRPGGRENRPPKSEWTFYPGAHEAVITPEEWAEYWQRRLSLSEPSRSIEARHLLTGLIYCADCGGRMHYSHGRYNCTRAVRFKGLGRTTVTISAPIVENAVEAWLMALSEDVDALAKARAATTDRKIRSVNDAGAISRRITAIDKRMAALTIKALDGTIPESAYTVTVKQLDEERASLSARQKSMALEHAKRELDMRELVVTLAGLWGRFETHERRQGLQKVASAVLVRTGRGEGRVTVVPRWEERS
ncbi:recombinase family protein [Microbacterium esteraromaticum]|uniref:recombinase family protein n=1 Tax=Microbacterium esteraromaticum TaxID=57043 RepID=UPI00236742B0|nr:recombinase family protein [Microbacterium esteraromaticum]WDH77868.1 recombinase family protein [Microbacterium esteraromaticum]